MAQRVLVTGGAGFIGSHIVDALLAKGDEVRVLDNLTPQIHGEVSEQPGHLNPEAEYIIGDVRDRSLLQRALVGVNAVSHHAAAVGVGQSMYEIAHYTDVNVGGTAVLLDVLANEKHTVERLVVASSMSVYGEGAYRCQDHGTQDVILRPASQLLSHEWEVHCPVCHIPLEPVPTSENKPLHPISVYAMNKRDQEEMSLCVGRAYDIATIALRYFNTYGPRQSLSNPYTGVIAIFLSRLLNGRPPLLYEDGRQTRDFTHVHDIVQANVRALRSDAPAGVVLNVGTGHPTSLLDLSTTINEILGMRSEIEISGKYRVGDIRHCYANISAVQAALGYEPAISLRDGIADLLRGLRNNQARDLVAHAQHELMVHGLTK